MADAQRTAGSTLPRRQLGRYLVEWRTRAGYTQVRAAQLLEMGATSLNRLEKGEVGRIKSIVIQAICELYGVPPDLTEALKGLAQQANVKSWWHQYGDLIPDNFNVYVGLETAATRIVTYQPDLIPGLLQTPDYNRALVQLIWPDETPEQWQQRVQIKSQRQAIVTRKTQPVSLDVVIGEAALRRVSGNHPIMSAQLRHLADLSTRDNVNVRVLGYDAGFPGGMSMPPFVVLTFGETHIGEHTEPPVVFLEGTVGDMYLEKEDDVQLYYRRYESIRAAALDETMSRSLLRRVAREHEQRER
ncbi:helix-turn-helix domain-containing protein [Nocardia vermiculata]|uniref:Helix-turn-helix domain-containing protein n=1 Tax=Nocardia vermiculata TaxID=257274 RepID=A0A846XZL4_9NOCA|nr:helix-turn-helix transcriptional regulator [Nocardia vermiculata]NKY52493.1 helix-turn-helix domain-containing protein [Nocardia vermiculata]